MAPISPRVASRVAFPCDVLSSDAIRPFLRDRRRVRILDKPLPFPLYLSSAVLNFSGTGLPPNVAARAHDLKAGTYNPDTRPALRLTLSGSALILTILTLMVSIHLVQPSLFATFIALAPVPCFIYNDYTAYLSLGPGGTPSTFRGYLWLKFLNFFAFKGRDVYRAPRILGRVEPRMSYLQATARGLNYRLGPRPTVLGIAPQRQGDQLGDPDCYVMLRKTLKGLGAQRPGNLFTDKSCFEKKGLALFAIERVNETCRGEVCHIHSSDGSLHLNLHPMDAKIVIDQGWGERHPLSKGGWMRRFVPKEFTLIYAPRSYEELEIVVRIVEAAVWWVTSREVQIAIPPLQGGDSHPDI